MKTSKVEHERFSQAVEILRREFPSLQFELLLEHPNVDAMLTFPRQAGLKFEVSINLQNCDELHLNAGEFWCEWFPCGDQRVFDAFIEVLRGVLSGSHRIVEYYRVDKLLKAELQNLVENRWKLVAARQKPHLPFSWKVETKILQNL